MFRDNWLKFGFGDNLGPMNAADPFVIDYSNALPHSTLSNPLDIAHDACRHIRDNFPGPITLMISGGVDSQAMAYAFHTAGINCKYVMARYNNGLNDHDIFSTSFYEDHGIPVEIMDVDVIGFHNTELKDWARKYQNNSPHLLTHCKIASMLEGTVVSSGAIVTRQNLSDMPYSVFGLERYAKISEQSVIGFFFSYCPHLVYATRDLLVDIHDAYAAKIEVYHRAGFPVIPQPNGKLHGFETLKKMFDSHEVDPKIKTKYLKHASSRPYDLMFRYPLVDIVNYSSTTKTIF